MQRHDRVNGSPCAALHRKASPTSDATAAQREITNIKASRDGAPQTITAALTTDANKNCVTSSRSQVSVEAVGDSLRHLHVETSTLHSYNNNNSTPPNNLAPADTRDAPPCDVTTHQTHAFDVSASQQHVLNHDVMSSPESAPNDVTAARTQVKPSSDNEVTVASTQSPASRTDDTATSRVSSASHATLARSQSASATSATVIDSVTSSPVAFENSSKESPVRLKRQPTKETRKCSVSDSEGYTQLNQYRLKDEIGKVNNALYYVLYVHCFQQEKVHVNSKSGLFHIEDICLSYFAVV